MPLVQTSVFGRNLLSGIQSHFRALVNLCLILKLKRWVPSSWDLYLRQAVHDLVWFLVLQLILLTVWIRVWSKTHRSLSPDFNGIWIRHTETWKHNYFGNKMFFFFLFGQTLILFPVLFLTKLHLQSFNTEHTVSNQSRASQWNSSITTARTVLQSVFPNCCSRENGKKKHVSLFLCLLEKWSLESFSILKRETYHITDISGCTSTLTLCQPSLSMSPVLIPLHLYFFLWKELPYNQ